MDLDKLLAELDGIGRIARSWKEQDRVAEIERQIILDKLRHIYEKVMFSGGVEVCESPAGKQTAPQAADRVGAAIGGAAGPSESSVPIVEANEPLPGVDGKIASEMSAVTDRFPHPEVSDRTEDAQPVSEPEAEQGEFVPQPEEPESVSGEAEAGNIEVSMTVEEHSVEQKLFSDEPLVRTRVDKRVILSLYGDDSSPRKTVTQVPSQYRTDEPQSSVPQFPLQPDAAAPESVPVPDPVIETVGSVVLGGESVPHVEIPHKKVLGETLANQTAAVNEVIGKKAAHTDVASRLRASQITDLRHSIGINDRFLLIRDLFGGKAEEYERVIDELDAFTELDDAMIYIQENFEWNPDCDGATLLVELLERKLDR